MCLKSIAGQFYIGGAVYLVGLSVAGATSYGSVLYVWGLSVTGVASCRLRAFDVRLELG